MLYCLIKVPDESFPMPTSPISTVTRVFKKITTPVKLFAQNLAKSEEPAQMNLLIEPFFSSKYYRGRCKYSKLLTTLI